MTSKLTSRWEDINPTTAAQYLESMEGNRAVRQSRVDFYAAQMRAGLWRETHQGIAFDHQLHMIDGQHRMWAIVESGCTIRIMVTRGVNAEDVVVVDSNLPRNFSDVAHYAGWTTTNSTAAAIAKIIAIGVTSRNMMVPHEITHQWYEHFAEAVDFAVKVLNVTRGVGTKCIPVSVASVFGRAWYTQDRAALWRMAEILKSGCIEREADRAAISLRDAWITKRLGTTDSDRYNKTQAAIRAFMERRPIRNLQAAELELFAVPPLPPALRFKPGAGGGRPTKAKQAA
jgi:hypothetical protein